MARLILILGDQLSPALASVRQWQTGDMFLLAEVQAEAAYVRHHQLKLVLIFSAMRHFAEALRQQQFPVQYVKWTDGCPSLLAAVQQTLAMQPQLTEVLLTEAGEYRLAQEIRQWSAELGCPVTVLEDDRFIASHAMFQRWASGRQQYRMEYFYREMRRYTGLLMDGNQPCGGQWNFDAENRKPLPASVTVPPTARWSGDAITDAVIAMVQQHFADFPGDASTFSYAVTGKDARAAFLHFVSHHLSQFGDYQDAMRQDEPFLFHSICSMYLNIGLLDVRWMCQKVEQAYQDKLISINTAEGFIRQLIGWREYVRGLYWLLMPDYATHNFFQATTPLPSFYWHGQTHMQCMAQAIGQTLHHGYAHHIQRLMVTGNFALLAGLSVKDITDWYLAVYVDAFEWVELPNTLGMALFGDGGVLASKPYAASGNYIAKMSNYCQGCRYNVKQTTEASACPFNALYWDFMARHEQKLSGNPRMQLIFQQWRKKSVEQQQAIRARAEWLLIHLEQL